jgi:hypothetical protein
MAGGIILVRAVPNTTEWSSVVVNASMGVTIVPPPIPRSPDAVPAMAPIPSIFKTLPNGISWIDSIHDDEASCIISSSGADVRRALRGTKGAAAKRKYPKHALSVVQSNIAVKRAPTGENSIADDEIKMVDGISTQLLDANVEPLTKAVENTAANDVPVRTR